jgi:hypothetical protein
MVFEDILIPQIILWPAYFFAFWEFLPWGPWASAAVALPAGIATAVVFWIVHDCWERRKRKG